MVEKLVLCLRFHDHQSRHFCEIMKAYGLGVTNRFKADGYLGPSDVAHDLPPILFLNFSWYIPITNTNTNLATSR